MKHSLVFVDPVSYSQKFNYQFSVSFLYLQGSSTKKQSGGLQSKTTYELPVSKLYIQVGLIRKSRVSQILGHHVNPEAVFKTK
jgi:hypothetical protein